MKIRINKEVFIKYPTLHVGFIQLTNIDNVGKFKEAKHLLRDMVTLISLSFHKESKKTHSLLSSWKSAQAELGGSAHRYHTLVEKLLKKVGEKNKITVKDVLTSLLYYASLKHLIPGGIDDCTKIKGGLTFAIASGKERAGVFKGVKQGALYYKDEKQVLGTKLDYWHAKTSPTKDSTSVLLHFEALAPITSAKFRTMMAEIRALLKTFCGGKSKQIILDAKKRTVNL